MHLPKLKSRNNNQLITKIFPWFNLIHYLHSNILVILSSNMDSTLIIILIWIIHTISILNMQFNNNLKRIWIRDYTKINFRMYNNSPNTNRHLLIIICYSLTSNSLMEHHSTWLLLQIKIINKSQQLRKRRINKQMKLQSSSNSIKQHSRWNSTHLNNTITLTIRTHNSSSRRGRSSQLSLRQPRPLLSRQEIKRKRSDCNILLRHYYFFSLFFN